MAKEGDVKPLRELLQKHISDSAVFRDEVKQYIYESKVHDTYTSKKLELVDKHETAHQKQKGAMWVLTTLGLVNLGHFIYKIFSSGN